MRASGKDAFRINNFDLIRLLAALQVALLHTLHHLNVQVADAITRLMGLFPGVPIFFFISGFLISKSYENNSILKDYAKNRFLRIYPALIVCTLVALLSVTLTGYFSKTDATIPKIATWIVGQVTFFQFYNPGFMRGFGTGVLNGSLWTITVELQFYVLVPVLYLLLLGSKKPRNIRLACLILLFLIINRVFFALESRWGGALFYKLWDVSFSPWFYMFLVGVLFQRNYGLVRRFLGGRIWITLPLYLSTAFLLVRFTGWQLGNALNPLLFLVLAGVVFSAAYSFPSLGLRILAGNDVSYGVYIYHIPVINMLLYFGLSGRFHWAWVALAATTFAALMSWFFVEKPCLKRKHHSLNPVEKGEDLPIFRSALH